MPLVSTILDEARFLLNDVSAKQYNNTVLLPPVKKAYRELQQNLRDNGVSVAREASGELTVTAGTTSLTFSSSPALPSDLLYPIMLHEKPVGTDDTNYVLMTETVWTPDTTQVTTLNFWSWLEDEIKLVGATVNVEVRIRYWKSLTAIVDGTTNIPILDCETFLAARTAALAAGFNARMPTLAAALSEDAEKALDILLSTNVKNRQSTPTRRRPFRAFRSRLFWRS